MPAIRSTRRQVLARLTSFATVSHLGIGGGMFSLSPVVRAALDTATTEAAAQASDLHCLLVWQSGTMLQEIYRTSRDRPIGSWWPREVGFAPDVLHDLRSISKSVVGLLVGQAVGRGQIDINTPVLDFFPELASLRDRRDGPGGAAHSSMTLAHLLDMASGLAWNEGATTYGTAANDETRLYRDGQPARYILDRPLVAAPGTTWNYNGGCTVLLAEVLRRTTGRSLTDLAGKDLFEPLGITHWEWRSGDHGQPLAYAGLRLEPRGLLTLGRLLLAGGQWEGRPLVPASWVAATLRPRISTGPRGLQYGLQWWDGTAQVGSRTLAWTAGIGNGGQRLFVLPELDLVVVMTAGQYNSDTIGAAELRLFRGIVAQMAGAA